MMRNVRFAVFPLAALLAFAIYLVNTSGTEKPEITETGPPPRILTYQDSLVMKYDTLITQKLDSANVVGAALVITHRGRPLLTKTYGVKEAGTTDSVDSHTIFRLASVSKTVTGVLAGVLHNEGIIGLDDPVKSYLPGFRLKDSVNTSDMTIRHLLSHTSGLVPHAYDNLVEAQVPFSTIMDSLFRVNISAPPGELYGYQNVMFSLFDTISAVKTGKSFEETLEEKVFLPFGMRDASAGFESFCSSENRALPHRRSGVGYRSMQLNDRYYLTNPAAGINASISDMENFLLSLNSRDPHTIHPLVADTVFYPQVRSPLRWIYLRQWDPVDSKHYGLGWRLIGYKDRMVAYHGGYVSGYKAEIAVCRDEDIGIAFLTNSPGRVGSEVVPLFLNMWFDSE
jgi:beta-lactamase class C